jgi:hypothetical protein
VTLALLIGAPAHAKAPSGDAFPAIAGWVKHGKPQSYGKDTVWQAINGAAQLYISYGFVRLREQSYRRGAKRSVTVQLYQQQSALGAYGVFARERPPGATELKLPSAGAAVSQGQAHCLAVKGRYYLKLVASTKLAAKDCKALLGPLSAWLPGPTGLPAALKQLPAKGRVAGSLRYTQRSCLGTRRLRRCLHADYQLGATKKRYTLFVLLPKRGKGAATSWKRLSGHWTKKTVNGVAMLTTTIPYRGTAAVLRRGELLVGAAGVGDLAATAALLAKLE